MNKRVVISRFLKCLGWLFILSAVCLTALGILYGITETDAFYARQDAYHALDPQREVLNNTFDSLYALRDDAIGKDNTDSLIFQKKIDSLAHSQEYRQLFDTPAPPVGFSLAGLLTVLAIIIAVPLLAIGIILVIIGAKTGKHILPLSSPPL